MGPGRDAHELPDMFQARILAIFRGYEAADNLDTLRDDSGAWLACQPTMSRSENAPATRELAHIIGVDDQHVFRQLSDPACGGDVGYRRCVRCALLSTLSAILDRGLKIIAQNDS